MPHTVDQSNRLSPLIFMAVPTEGDIIVPFWTQFCNLFVLGNVFPGLILCPKVRGLPTVISGISEKKLLIRATLQLFPENAFYISSVLCLSI